MPWWIGTLFGAVVLVLGGYLQKTNTLSVSGVFKVFPVIAMASLGFWYGYQNSERFISTWFFGTALCAVLAILFDTFFMGKSWTILTLVGVSLIITGSWMVLKY